jgi:N-acetylglucosaminyl-diphospho-decaprenol L-rhamnosyltransferase
VTGPFQGGTDAPRVSAVVVSFNTRNDLLRCLASLAAHVRLPLEVVVVDNASADGSADAVRRAYPTARVVESPTNRGFSAANNEGIRVSSGPQVLVLNSDAEVTAGAVESLSAVLDARPDVGVVGPLTRSLDGSIQVSFGPDLTPLAEWRQRRLVRGVRERRPEALREAEARAGVEHEPDWVSGSCFLARRTALDAVGGFDEGYFLYEEDADLCRRLRRVGWHVLHTPRAEVRHALGRSMAEAGERSRLEYRKSHLRYYRKHNGLLQTGLLVACLLLDRLRRR